MDDSHSSKKGPTTFVHGPEMEGSLSGGDNSPPAAGQIAQEEIKRDLHSRHINMIAIAGMIVRCPSFSSSHSVLSIITNRHHKNETTTPILKLRH
jgi:amino acid permease